jgi:amino acid transporter
MLTLARLPVWLTALLIIGGFVVASVGGLLLFHRLARGRVNLPEDMNNDVIFFASAIGVFYSLTAGLIAVGVWTNYSDVQTIVASEAASIAALYRDVTGLPQPLRGELQEDLRDYTEFVINEAWPAQYGGVILDGGTDILNRFQDRLFAYEPPTAGQQNLHAEALRQYNELITFRRERVDAVDGGLPGVMWAIMLLWAFLAITVTYLLSIRRSVHIVLTAFLAAFIGLVVFTVAGLDKPLSGPLAIEPDSYRLVLERLLLR